MIRYLLAAVFVAPLAAAPQPPAQRDFLARFDQACTSYGTAPNDIRKSAIFRESRPWITSAVVSDWTGTLKRLHTNQGGALLDIDIIIGTATVMALKIPATSPIYRAATDMREGQKVTFSGKNLKDFNMTERGSVCRPDFTITLTSLR